MLHHFNPGHETAVLNASPHYTLPSNLFAMQTELAFLPAWYANQNDNVLVTEKLDADFMMYLTENLNLKIDAVTPKQIGLCKNKEVRLWGISPQAIRLFNDLSRSDNVDLQIPEWNDTYTYLNSRLAAKDALTTICNALPHISKRIIPTFYSSLAQIEDAVRLSPTQLLAKAPYSSSGRGLIWLPIGDLTRVERQLLTGILNKQGMVSVEQSLNKQVDFAMEFLSDGQGGVLFEGYSLFKTNSKGAYLGNYLGSQQNIQASLSEHIPLDELENVKQALIKNLTTTCASFYKGCIGVDMLIYKDIDDRMKLHPCLEINMRYNMGYLALRFFANFVSPHSEGHFHIDFSAKEGDIYSKHQQMQKEHPAHFENGKIQSGYLALCLVNKESKYRAYVIVSEK